MAITKQKKIEIVENLKKIISGAGSLVFVNFHGLTVGEATKLRKTLKSKDIGYLVAKKTLFRRAVEGAKIEGQLPELPGELAVVSLLAPDGGQAGGDDVLEPAREIYSFQKNYPEMMKIIGGVFEGKFLGAAAMTEIATIPSREVLLAQFVNLINSPIQRLAMVLGQVAGKKGSA